MRMLVYKPMKPIVYLLWNKGMMMPIIHAVRLLALNVAVRERVARETSSKHKETRQTNKKAKSATNLLLHICKNA